MEGMIMANHIDPETCLVGLSDQESRTKNVVHDPCSDQDQTCQTKDPVVSTNCDNLWAKSFVFPDSSNAEEGKLFTVSVENAEVDESFSGSLTHQIRILIPHSFRTLGQIPFLM